MFQMMGVFAEFERTIIAERVRAGLARARSEGKRLGRPPIAPSLERRIREALAIPGRPSVRVIAKRFGVDPGTVQRISRPLAGASVVSTDWPLAENVRELLDQLSLATSHRFRTIQVAPRTSQSFHARLRVREIGCTGRGDRHSTR